MGTSGFVAKGILRIGNVIKNVIEGKEGADVLNATPDIITNGSVTKLMSAHIISPNIIVDKDLEYLDQAVFKDLIKTEVNMFSSITVQALRIMVELYGVTPEIALTTINRSNKDLTSDLQRAYLLGEGLEHYDYVGDLLHGKGPLLTPGLEAAKTMKSKTNTLPNSEVTVPKDMTAYANTFEVKLSVIDAANNPRVIVIPLIIIPNIMYTDSNSLLNSMVNDDVTKDILSRIDEYRAGVISLADLIFATDLVKQYKNKKVSNNNDFADYLNKVDKTNAVRDLLHNRNSFSKNYNMYILDISKKTVVEDNVKGSIYKTKYINKAMDGLDGFSMTFVDERDESVMIFINDIDGFSALNFNQLKGGKKDDDVTTILKAMMENKNPF